MTKKTKLLGHWMTFFLTGASGRGTVHLFTISVSRMLRCEGVCLLPFCFLFRLRDPVVFPCSWFLLCVLVLSRFPSSCFVYLFMSRLLIPVSFAWSCCLSLFLFLVLFLFRFLVSISFCLFPFRFACFCFVYVFLFRFACDCFLCLILSCLLIRFVLHFLLFFPLLLLVSFTYPCFTCVFPFRVFRPVLFKPVRWTSGSEQRRERIILLALCYLAVLIAYWLRSRSMHVQGAEIKTIKTKKRREIITFFFFRTTRKQRERNTFFNNREANKEETTKTRSTTTDSQN